MTTRERMLLGWTTAAIGAAMLTPPLPGIRLFNRGIYLLWEVEPGDIGWWRCAAVCSAWLAALAGCTFALHQPKG